MMRGCDVDGCPLAHQARGYCTNHYYALRVHGDPHAASRDHTTGPAGVIDDAWGHWFAGLTDGEGHFGINRMGGYRAVCLFEITLRDDDAPILLDAKERLGTGSTTYRHRVAAGQSPQMAWRVSSHEGCRRVIDLFDRYPLRSKKAVDFSIWTEGVAAWGDIARLTRGQNGRNGGHELWEPLLDIQRRLMAARVYKETTTHA